MKQTRVKQAGGGVNLHFPGFQGINILFGLGGHIWQVRVKCRCIEQNRMLVRISVSYPNISALISNQCVIDCEIVMPVGNINISLYYIPICSCEQNKIG